MKEATTNYTVRTSQSLECWIIAQSCYWYQPQPPLKGGSAPKDTNKAIFHLLPRPSNQQNPSMDPQPPLTLKGDDAHKQNLEKRALSIIFCMSPSSVGCTILHAFATSTTCFLLCLYETYTVKNLSLQLLIWANFEVYDKNYKKLRKKEKKSFLALKFVHMSSYFTNIQRRTIHIHYLI